jgi:protein-serine/threonine kinase
VEAKYLRFLRTPNRIEDYDTITIIGKGAFGEVKLVRRKRDAKLYALKSQLKTQMIAQSQLARVRAERDILAEAESPWVVELHTTFQDSRFLYMLMEFLPGGDLMTMASVFRSTKMSLHPFLDILSLIIISPRSNVSR